MLSTIILIPLLVLRGSMAWTMIALNRIVYSCASTEKSQRMPMNLRLTSLYYCEATTTSLATANDTGISALSSTSDPRSTSQNKSQAVQAHLYTAMRLSSTLTWAALAHLAWSSSDEALICISEKAQETTGRPPVISPEIARLVLGRRLDLSRYQTLGDIDGQVLDILNDLPGKRLQLFLDEQPNTFPRVLTVVEDVKDTEGTLSFSSLCENIC